MKNYRKGSFFYLHAQQKVHYPLMEVFEFFNRPENLAKITPPSMGFIIKSPSPVVMAEGSTIEYSIQLGPLQQRWVSKIRDYHPPHEFTDLQLYGPYRSWIHRHTFLEVPDGTLVEDLVEYSLPLGPLGHLAHWLWVKRELKKIFSYRENKIREFFP